MYRLCLIAELRLHGFPKIQRLAAAHLDRLQSLAHRPSRNIRPSLQRRHCTESSPWRQLLLISRHRIQRRILCLTQIRPEDHRSPVIGGTLQLEIVVNSAVAEPVLTAAHRHPRLQLRRRPVPVRHQHQRAILQQTQQRPIRREPQRPCPVVFRLIGRSRPRRQPAERLIESIKREIHHQLGPTHHTQVLPQRGQEQRTRSLNLVDSR